MLEKKKERKVLKYVITGETPDNRRFELPVRAESEADAIDKAKNQLPDEYDVQSAKLPATNRR